METELGDGVIHALTTVYVCEQNHSQRYKDMLEYMLMSSEKLDTLGPVLFCTPKPLFRVSYWTKLKVS